MILSFSEKNFPQLIMDGVKKITFRKDTANRWKVGNKIEFWYKNPRNTRNKSDMPYCFGNGYVFEKYPAMIDFKNKIALINGIALSGNILEIVARDDGFESFKAMADFFKSDSFTGIMIVWRYADCKFNSR
jgi:hypothetical protein